MIDMRAHPLGSDSHGNQYYYFSQFCGDDVRIYREAPLPALEVRVPDLSIYQAPVKVAVVVVVMMVGMMVIVIKITKQIFRISS